MCAAGQPHGALCCSPETEETKAQFRGLLSSLHDSFKDHVRQARSGKLRGSQDELFSGQHPPVLDEAGTALCTATCVLRHETL